MSGGSVSISGIGRANTAGRVEALVQSIADRVVADAASHAVPGGGPALTATPVIAAIAIRG